MCHVNELPRYHVNELPRYLRFVCRTELLCGGSFCSCWGTLSASTGDTGS